MPRPSYDHREIEKKAQEQWEALGLHTADLADTTKDPYYLLVEFPYPSGDLHVGHWYAFAVTDIYARYLRLKGKNVLFPFGFDAFGLPAENAAIKRGLDPKKWTYENMAAMRAQVHTMGTSLDWSKEVVTCDPDYYKWTQWLFAKLYEHDLAYRAEAAVKWCPNDQTVLANEQVIDGRCERCGHEVVEKRLTQWFLKITEYADRLLADLDALPWREDIKDAQRAWIGKSEGAKLRFQVLNAGNALAPVSNPDGSTAIEVFTTRPDTIFGATYVVLAPEHPLVDTLLPSLENGAEIGMYRAQTAKKTERERSENKEKTGVELHGVRAINPATTEEIPVYIADYVLASYGTGAVMAVPAHDERDFAFAKAYGLPIRYVIDPVTGEPQENPKDKGKIVAVVEHEGKILTIHWPQELGGRLLVGGTAEEGEDAAVTAAREIAEETGYTDLELIEQADEMVHHSYYAFSKKQATIAHTTLLHFRLKSDRCEEQKLEADEHGKFTVEWVTPEQARAEIHDDQHQYALARFTDHQAYTGDGLLRNSGVYDGQDNRAVMGQIVETIGGERTTNYRLRDWLISRQRYWGCPIPVVYDPEGKPHLVPSEHLPWTLPEDVDFTPTGQSPLASSQELKDRVTRIFGEGWTPEFDTLDTFVDSSWYFTRYLAPHATHDFSDQALMKAWLPVNRYSGGSEHTTMHLLYARFFYKALHDLALVPTSEPFFERFNRGLILGPDGQKMSKSKGNVINPDEYVQKYGADAVRIYLAFIGPYNEPGNYPWKPEGVEAMRRFLDRVAALAESVGESEQTEGEQRALAKAAQKVGSDTERFKLNTAVAALMILMNELEALPGISRASYLQLIVMLAPFAPHLSEHLFQSMRADLSDPPESVHQVLWPEFDSALLALAEATVIVQVAGKKRGEVSLSLSATEQEALKAALELSSVQTALEGRDPGRVVYVPGKILSLVP